MKNLDVIRAWTHGKSAIAPSLKTDGNLLFSYRLCIGRSDNEGNKVLFDYTSKGGESVSQTTSTHVNLAKRNSNAEVMRPDAAKHAGLINGSLRL
jgi:hypothetical protein